MRLEGTAQISTGATEGSTGSAGDITIRAEESIELIAIGSSAPRISSDTATDVDAGSILLEAPLIRTTTSFNRSSIHSTTSAGGQAGSVTLRADELSLGGEVTTDTSGSGDEGLRSAARSYLRARNGDVEAAEGLGKAISTMIAYGDAPQSVVRIPLHDGSRYLGSLVALEAIGVDKLTAWSRWCGAQVSIRAPSPKDDA